MGEPGLGRVRGVECDTGCIKMLGQVFELSGRATFGSPDKAEAGVQVSTALTFRR
jgi:hypothetical protein